MNNQKMPILITGIGGGGHGEQILKALKLVKKNRYFIVGADANSHCAQFSMVDAHSILPLANDPAYIDALLSLCNKYKVKALFHGCEPELKQLSQNRDIIEKEGIFLPINPTPVIDLCMNKELTNDKLSSLGFPSPKFQKISTKNELSKIDWFPVVVKPSVGGGGSANVYIAQNSKELLGLADYLGLESTEGSFFIQEYVGTPDDEYTVGVLHDMDGNYINSIAVRRLLLGPLNIRMSVPNRTDRFELGKKLVVSSGVSHGYIGKFEAVTSQCREIAKAIGARGPINIQCRFVDGIVKVFEINPRFSGTTSLRAMVGYNEPEVLMNKHLFSEDVEVDFPFEESLILRTLVENKEQIKG